MWWMFLVLFYGVLKGVREVVKKKAMEKSTVMEVLFFYTFLAFLFVVPQAKEAGGLETKFYFYIALKSFVIFLAWIFSFKALEKMPISLYGVLDLSRVLFATCLGVFVLGEELGIFQVMGLIFVSAGLLLLKCQPGSLKEKKWQKKAQSGEGVSKEERKEADGQEKLEAQEKATQKGDKVQTIYVIAAFASCMLNAFSGFMDKVLMKEISSSQLQFWYMLFLVIYYGIYILLTGTKLRKTIWKNGWIWLLAILFVAADKALFVANGMEGSRVTVMTLLKQSGCVVTILAGKFIFKEKNVGYKLICAAVIVAGIVIGVL